ALGEFLEDRCKRSGEITASALHAELSSWCFRQGADVPVGLKQLAAAVVDRWPHVESKRVEGTRRLVGVSIRGDSGDGVNVSAKSPRERSTREFPEPSPLSPLGATKYPKTPATAGDSPRGD